MKLDRNTVIIPVDGGICSQIACYLYGYGLEKRGFRVKYDLTFYYESSLDMDGKFARNFDMLKAFPGIHHEEATAEEIKAYKEKCFAWDIPIDQVKAPQYLAGYGRGGGAEQIYIEEFKQLFNPIDADTCAEILEKIKATNSCAVHVRRGDLSHYTEAYGEPCSVEYFTSAIQQVMDQEKDPVFFFFSDEPEWITKNILPCLPRAVNYELCTQNGSDKGYLDLYLITHAKHIIASLGSLGRDGKKFQRTPGGIMIAPTRHVAEHVHPASYSLRQGPAFLKILIKLIPVSSWRRKLRNKYFPR